MASHIKHIISLETKDRTLVETELCLIIIQRLKRNFQKNDEDRRHFYLPAHAITGQNEKVITP